MERRFLLAAASSLALLVLLRDVPEASSSESFPDDCGTRPVVEEITGNRIIGGHDAQLGAWPWQISLQVYQLGQDFTHICGGSLINHNSVLTAAHCIKKWKAPEYWRAVIGLHNIHKAHAYTVKSRIRAITVHISFDKESYVNDLALFKLMDSIRFNDYIQPICLPEVSLPTTNETPCYISGWGYTQEKGRSRDVLQEAQINVIPRETCNRYDWYGGIIKEDMLCAGSETGGVDSCQGDSGGPLMCYFPDVSKYYLVGVTSFGSGCGRPKLPGVYTNVANYRSWIKTQVIQFNRTAPVSISCALTFLIAGWVTFYLVL